MLRCPSEKAVSHRWLMHICYILTEPESIGRGVPGLELWCIFLEVVPFGRGKGVWGLDIIS